MAVGGCFDNSLGCQFLRRKEAPKAKMEKNTIKPANVAHITMAIATPRIFVEFFLMSLLDISFASVQQFAFADVWAGVDSVWEQEKLEARKMLVNAAESPASSACFVGRFLLCKTRRLKKRHRR
jgi:hypothetical protein